MKAQDSRVLVGGLAVVAILTGGAAILAEVMGTAFTYQGRLTDANGPANGEYDFEFTLYDANSGPNVVGSTLTEPNVLVSNGVFATDLDFGGRVFLGAARWLEIAVQPAGGGGYTTLSPRQAITAAPYALHARETFPVFSVRDFGAVGDANADDTVAIDAAIQAAPIIPPGTSGARPILVFPPGDGYRTTSTIYVPAGMAVRMDAPIVYGGDDTSAALVLGEPGVQSVRLHHRLDVIKEDANWTDGDEIIGIQIINAAVCQIEITQASGFAIGVQCIGSGRLFGYNEFHLGQFFKNKVALELTNINSGVCNENVFLNGQFTNDSNTDPNDSRYGIRITSEDGTYTSNNNNLFIKPSFELGDPNEGEGLPILIEHGVQNAFISCRNEGNSGVLARILNDSSQNEFNTGIPGSVDPPVDDQSTSPSSWTSTRQGRLTDEPGTVLFVSGPLHSRACYYDGASRVHVPAMGLFDVLNAEVYQALDGLSIVQGADAYLGVPFARGVGVFVDTSRLKRFVVRKDVVTGFGGRVRVRCYDPNGNVLGGETPPYVTGIPGALLQYANQFGGTYFQGGDSHDDFFFRVAGEVQRIAVFIGGVDNVCKLRGFSLFSVDGSSASVWPGYEEGMPGANLAISPPTAGTWQQGRILFNANPVVDGPIGWVCIAGGTPGTWSPFGIVAQLNPGGTVVFPGSDTTTVTFSTPEADASYFVTVTGNANETIWVTNKSTTGFTIHSSNGSSTTTVDWILMR